MVKLRVPLLSLRAAGGLTRLFALRRHAGITVLEKKPAPKDARSPGQLSWRHMYQKCAYLWNALSDEEKAEWEALARPLHMPGFAYWQSQCLKPNPGIYLPLQGGIMQGEIDMNTFSITDLPDPAEDHEPVTLGYFNDHLPAGPYTQGCRVYHSVDLAIPSGVLTILPFNSERRDTDNIHSTTVNPERLTCQTAGVYLVKAQIDFALGAGARRSINIRKNGVFIAVNQLAPVSGANDTIFFVDTAVELGVGDYVYTSVFQDSGGDLTLYSRAQYSPEFMMQRIG